MDFDIVSNSVEQTIELGRTLGAQLRGGQVVGLIGPLGSGKTQLIKGIAAGVGAEGESQVCSPTFVIVKEYIGRLEVYHIDAYRLDSVAEFEKLGFDDFCYPGSVVVIEWADKVEASLKGINYIRADLCHEGAEKRRIIIKNLPVYIEL